jgi:hypothetical protein
VDFVARGQSMTDCDFNRAALHPADPIECRTSTQRTQAPESVDTRRAFRLDPLENNIRRLQPSGSRKYRPFQWFGERIKSTLLRHSLRRLATMAIDGIAAGTGRPFNALFGGKAR